MSWPSAGSSLLFGFLLELAYLFPQWNLLIFCTKICSLTSLLCCISVFIFSVATYFSFALFTWDSGFFRALCKFHAPLIFNVLPLPCNKLVHVRGCWFPLLLPFDRPALYFSSALVLVYCLFFSNLSNFPLLSLQFFSFGLPSLLFLIKFPLDWSDDNLVDFRLMLMLLLWRGKRNTETEREKRRKNWISKIYLGTEYMKKFCLSLSREKAFLLRIIFDHNFC